LVKLLGPLTTGQSVKPACQDVNPARPTTI
jgi:hypothetical protein